MGAKTSTIVYRRNRVQMPAREDEIKSAIEDGVEFIYNTKVLEVETENKKIKTVKCLKTQTIDDKIIDLGNSEFFIQANSIIYAIGAKIDKELIQNEEIEISDKGLIKIEEKYMTNLEGVFAGGDATQSKSTVCMAIYDGKRASEEIVNYCLRY